jgi:ADP-ribose pyrophosphatase YjhB (NUDIX family)
VATNANQRPQVAVGALVIREKEVLLVQRGREPGAGQWALPGGRVHWGETLAQAAKREVLEETGIDIEVGHIIYTFDSITRDESGVIRFHYVIIDFLARPVRPGVDPVPADDAADARWFNLDELLVYPVSKSTLELVEQYFTRPV